MSSSSWICNPLDTDGQDVSQSWSEVLARRCSMPRYDIHYQKGLSLREFMARYGSEDQCIEAVCRAR